MRAVAGPATPNIRHDFTPHPEWETTGEVWPTDYGPQPVYREKVLKRTFVPVIGKDGEPEMIVNYKTGETIRPKTRPVDSWETREFILYPLGNGITGKNFHFRPDPADAQRAQRKVARESFMERLMQAAERKGLSPEEIADAIDALEDTDDSATFPKHIGGATWELSDGTRFQGSRKAAEQAEKDL